MATSDIIFNIKTERKAKMKKTAMCAFLAVVGAFACCGDSITVNNVNELYDAIDALNNKSTRQYIYLGKGHYDVSGHQMRGGSVDAHIAATNITFAGNTDNPEDVVVYGNLSRSVFFMRNGDVMHLTISNGLMGVYASGTTATMTNIVVTCCSNPNGSGGGGYRGMWRCCKIVGNKAKSGGGLYLHSTTASKAYGCLLTNNCAYAGGGIWGGEAYGCRIVQNDADTQGGGTYGTKVHDSEIHANTVGRIHPDETYSGVTVCGGGGVYGGAVISNCTITGNAVLQRAIASRQGGGVWGTDDTMLYDCLVANNVSIQLSSGITGGSAIRCAISNNASTAIGYTLRGLRRMEDCDMHGAFCHNIGAISRCRFSGMTGQWALTAADNPHTNGTFNIGTSHTLFNSSAYMTNCLVANNTATSLFNSKNASQSAVNCTFADNHVKYFSSEATANNLNIVNSIFSKNTDRDGTPHDEYFKAGADGCTNITILCSAFDKPVSTDANRGPAVQSKVYQFPSMNFDRGNESHPYSLKHSSPVRGLGELLGWTAGDVDIRNITSYPRMREGKVDLGCYQCWLNPFGTTIIFR